MKKLREIFEFTKEKLKNPRTRAATILGIYFIFFIFIFVGLKTPTSDNQNNNGKNITNYDIVQTDYKYKHAIEISTTDNTLRYLVSGSYINERETQKIEFYNKETNQYEETNEYQFINEKLLDLNIIIDYLNNIESEFSTEYKDGTIQKNYLIPITKIDETLNNKDNIEINIYEKDEFITKIIIDSSNLDKIYNENFLKVKYILEYSKSAEIVDTNG